LTPSGRSTNAREEKEKTMNRSSRSFAHAVVFGLVGAASIVQATALATADEPTGVRTYKPLAGISLAIGSKRMAGYFEAGSGECTLTLMVADGMVGDELPIYSPVRLIQTIAPGATASVDTQEGKSLEFGCKPRATAMTVRVLDVLAIYKPAR